MDYESLRQELALKAPLWRKVSSTESHQDSSTTVVYRMDSVTEWKEQKKRMPSHTPGSPSNGLYCMLRFIYCLWNCYWWLVGFYFVVLDSGSIDMGLLPGCVRVNEWCFLLLCYLNGRLWDGTVSACREALMFFRWPIKMIWHLIEMKDCHRLQMAI